MAVSAFKSTTRRNCSATIANKSNVSSVQKPIGNPSPIGVYRRSSSLTDIGQTKYANGSPASRECKMLATNNFRSLTFLDRQFSESDPGKRYNGDTNDDINHHIPRIKILQQHHLSLNQTQEEEKDKLNSHQALCISSEVDKNGGDNHQGQAEEKIIQAVYAQTKPFKTMSFPRKQLHAGNLYDTIHADVLQAAAGIRNELEQSLGKAWSSESSTYRVENKTGPFLDEVTETITNVWKNNATKVQQMQKMKLYLTIEEQQCLHIVHLFKELLSGLDHLSRLQTAIKEDVGRVSEKIDEDPQKYIKWDAYLYALNHKEHGTAPKEEQPLLSETYREKNRNFEDQSKKCHYHELQYLEPLIQLEECIEARNLPVNKDGIVLPWLQWEVDTELASSAQISQPQLEAQQGTVVSDGKNNSRLENNENRGVEIPSGEMETSPKNKTRDSSRINVISTNCNRSSSSTEATPWSGKRSFQAFETQDFMVEKIQLNSRIKRGEIVLCSPLECIF